MKNKYEDPQIVILELLKADIVTASGNDIEEDNGENDGEWI